MRIATWNVNSIRTRARRVLDFLDRADIDVLAMQEIKCKPEQFPYDGFDAAGYEVIAHGRNQWNGVAFASRLPIEDATADFSGQPEFRDAVEARALGVTVEGLRLWNVYVPNGRELDDPHYAYKLEWLAALRRALQAEQDGHPELAVMGDFNIAPRDCDVWDISVFAGRTHVSVPERAALAALLDSGFEDVALTHGADGYTYWDYQQLRFPRNEGMRIDLALATAEFAELVSDVRVERDERGGDGPSDHVPVVVDVDVQTELDDDAPMIF